MLKAKGGVIKRQVAQPMRGDGYFALYQVGKAVECRYGQRPEVLTCMLNKFANVLMPARMMRNDEYEKIT
ncbi:MAG: hypothetical protein A3F12_07885 [Gammaproteobacteria bacterium RIFCSPHIGHO2_12_FULL_38_14]|nr:MAG: hypothetical protein A3F12_07885 [Gammaproteobacteria bacterium RIFCSPHIGHO2_12_FULL_38_14]